MMSLELLAIKMKWTRLRLLLVPKLLKYSLTSESISPHPNAAFPTG